MSFLDWFFGQSQPRTPTIPSILPDVAKNEITQGRLPHINVDELFTKPGEICHYAERAILTIEKTKKVVNSRNHGVSTPGIFKGDRYHWGGTSSTVDEIMETEHHKGMLYVTNKRIIFRSKTTGFDKQYRYLSSVKPYSNAIELQYGSVIYSIFVPDGSVIYSVIQMLK